MITETDEHNSLRRLDELLQKQDFAARKLTTEFEKYQDVVGFKNHCERTFSIFGAIIGEMGEFVNKSIDEGLFNMFRKMLDMQQKSLIIAMYNLTLKRGGKGAAVAIDPGLEIGVQVTDGQDGGFAETHKEEHGPSFQKKSTFGAKPSRLAPTKSLLTERSARKQMNSSTMSISSKNASVKKPRAGMVTNEALLSKETITKVKWDLPMENRTGGVNCNCGCHVQTFDGEEATVNFFQTGNKYFFEQASSVKGGHTKRLEDLQNHDELVLDTEAERLLTSLNSGRGYTKAAKLNPMIVIRASEMIASDINQSLVKGLNQLSKELADSQFFVYKEGSANIIIENLQKLIDDNSNRAREDLELKKPLLIDGKNMAEVEEALMARIRDSMVDVVKRLTKNIKNMHSQYGISQGVMTVINGAEMAEREAEMVLRLESNDKEIQELILSAEAQRMQLEYYEAVSKESANQVAHSHEAEEQMRGQLSRTTDRLNECERNLKKLLDRQTVLEKEDLKSRAVMRRLNHFFFQLQNVMISEVAIRRGVQSGFEVKGERVEQNGFDEDSLQQLLDFFVLAFNKSTSDRYSITGPIVIHTDGTAGQSANMHAGETVEDKGVEMMNEHQLMTVFEEVERNEEILSADLRLQAEKAAGMETAELLAVQGGKIGKSGPKKEQKVENGESQTFGALDSLRLKDSKSNDQFDSGQKKTDKRISPDTRPHPGNKPEPEGTPSVQKNRKAEASQAANLVRKEPLSEYQKMSVQTSVKQEADTENSKNEQKKAQTAKEIEKQTLTPAVTSNKSQQALRNKKQAAELVLQNKISLKDQSAYEPAKLESKKSEPKQMPQPAANTNSTDFLEAHRQRAVPLSSARCLSIFLHRGTLKVEGEPVALEPDLEVLFPVNEYSTFASVTLPIAKQKKSIAAQALNNQTELQTIADRPSTANVKSKVTKKTEFQIAEVIKRTLRTNDIKLPETRVENSKSKQNLSPPLPSVNINLDNSLKIVAVQSTSPKASTQVKAKQNAQESGTSPEGLELKRRKKIRKPENYKTTDFSILNVLKVEEIILHEKRRPIPPQFLLDKLNLSPKSGQDPQPPLPPITPINNLSYVPALPTSAKKLSPDRQSASPTAKKIKRKLLISDVKFDLKLLKLAKADAKRNEKTAKKQVRIVQKSTEITNVYALLVQRQNKKAVIPDLEEKILDLTAAELSSLLDFVRTFFGMIQSVPLTPSEVLDGGDKPAVLFLLKKHNFSTINQFIQFNELLRDFVIRKTRRQDLYFPEEQDLSEIKHIGLRQPLMPIRLPGNLPSLQSLSMKRQEVLNPAQSVNELVTSMFASKKVQENSVFPVAESPKKNVVKSVFKGSNFKRKRIGPENNTAAETSKMTNCLSNSKIENQRSEADNKKQKEKLSLPKIAGRKVFDESVLSVGNANNLSSDQSRNFPQKSFRPPSRLRTNRQKGQAKVVLQLQDICHTERTVLPMSKRFNFSICRKMHEQSDKLEIIGQQACNTDREPTESNFARSPEKHDPQSRASPVKHSDSQLHPEEPKSGVKKRILSRLASSAHKSSKFDLKPLELDSRFAGVSLPTDQNFTIAVQNSLTELLSAFEALVCKIPPRLEPMIKTLCTAFLFQHKRCPTACPHFCDFAKTLSSTLYQNLPIILNAKSVIYTDAMSPRFGDGGRINFQKPAKV